MYPAAIPVFRLTTDCIRNSFRSSHKHHLILTGTRKCGKTTLLPHLFPHPFPGITTWAEPGKAMEELRLRDNVFCLDPDAPFENMGCVIMASGMGKRFGGNKLMADFKGKPLLQWTLDATDGIFSRRIVVTRHKDVEKLCLDQEIEVISHTMPGRNDTVRLGLQAMEQEVEGCLFCPGDQPLLRWETIASLVLNAVNEKNCIWRAAYEDTAGSPVLFPKWTFPELMTLPEGKGGSFLLKKYPEKVRKVFVADRYELMDIDTPAELKVLSER